MSVWDEIFAMRHIEPFAWAVVRLYETLDKLERDGFDTVVLPSRGTSPFHHLLDVVHELLPMNRQVSGPAAHRRPRPLSRATISLPFTADVSDENRDESASIRDYWVQVLRAMVCGDRTSAPLRYYQHALVNLFGFDRDHGAPIHRPSSRFVFVDTAISGRAICEIFDAFDRRGLTDFHIVLIVDQEGQRLKQTFARRLDELEAGGRLTRINVTSLFTEDRGPVLTATWCYSAPQLVVEGAAILRGVCLSKSIGTAVSFIRVSNDSKLRTGDAAMAGAVGYQLLRDCIKTCLDDEKPSWLEPMRQELVKRASEKQETGHNVLDVEATERIARAAIAKGIPIALGRQPLPLTVTKIEVSGSHVVRLFFEKSAVRRFLDAFVDEPAEGFWCHRN